jgi:hypothetical protein
VCRVVRAPSAPIAAAALRARDASASNRAEQLNPILSALQSSPSFLGNFSQCTGYKNSNHVALSACLESGNLYFPIDARYFAP